MFSWYKWSRFRFFRKLKENTKVNLVWNGNLKKGILGFLLGFIPDRIGIVEFLKPIDEVFLKILYMTEALQQYL